jgi:ribulose-phosphate 3-epimerase
MATICPTVTATDPHQYREQVERVASFAERMHLDFMDGLFVKVNSPKLEQFWWPHSIPADLHLMCERPDLYIEEVLKLEPSMVIIHAEAEGSFNSFAKKMHLAGVKIGVALLQGTKVELIESSLDEIDHVLIFSGSLGHFGGEVDLDLLAKVKQLKKLKPSLEIGWDGGINDHNAQELVKGGIDILNVGGFIQRAATPDKVYAKMKQIIETVNDQKTNP